METKVTFKPLSRGRFRCKQSNTIVKKSKTDQHRRQQMNKGKGVSPKKETIQRIVIDYWGHWICFCNKENTNRYAAVGSIVACSRCGKKSLVLQNNY